MLARGEDVALPSPSEERQVTAYSGPPSALLQLADMIIGSLSALIFLDGIILTEIFC